MFDWTLLGLPLRDIPMLLLLGTIIYLAIRAVMIFLRGILRGLRDES